MFLSILFIIIGLAILVYGASLLVGGAVSVSRKAGISPLVIGLTIVAFGTSAPELVVNLVAAAKGTTDVAIGNIIGSNTANILIILGLSATIAAVGVARSTAWKEVPFALLAVMVVYILGNDVLFSEGTSNTLSRGDGFILLSFFAIFMYYIFGMAKEGGEASSEAEEMPVYGTLRSSAMIAGGLVGLFVGGQLLVTNAVEIARALGMTELLIGLTIVAVGTSLPELATSVLAAKKGQSDIAIGNVVGSNIFNIFWILGLTSVITPVPVSTPALFDILFCAFTTVLLFVFIFVGKKYKITRTQGVLLLLIYGGYVSYILLRG
jgi:cation:H+ antiporter